MNRGQPTCAKKHTPNSLLCNITQPPAFILKNRAPGPQAPGAQIKKNNNFSTKKQFFSSAPSLLHQALLLPVHTDDQDSHTWVAPCGGIPTVHTGYWAAGGSTRG